MCFWGYLTSICQVLPKIILCTTLLPIRTKLSKIGISLSITILTQGVMAVGLKTTPLGMGLTILSLWLTLM
jgi:uncharacterized membrane protein